MLYRLFYLFGELKTLSINTPNTLDLDNRELIMLVVTRLYEKGKMSLGQAAKQVGMTKRAFKELLY